MPKRAPNALLLPDPRLTNNLREDVMACAGMFQNKHENFTRALRDPDTRKEMRRLVSDLFSLCEIILDDDTSQ